MWSPSRPAVRLTAWLAVLGLIALVAAAAPAPAAAQTATPGGETNGTNATAAPNGTAIAVEFDRQLSPAERERAVRTIERRLNGSPTYEGSVETAGDRFVVQVRPVAPPAVVELLLQRGNLTVTARNPEVTGVRLFSNAGVARVGDIRTSGGTAVLPVQLTRESAGRLSATLSRLNHTSNPGGCDAAARSGYCLVVSLDGRVVNTAGITAPFAAAIADGRFNDTGRFGLSASDAGDVVRMQVALAGAPLPANATAAGVENVSTFEPVTPTPEPETVTLATTGGTATPPPGRSSPGFTALLALLSFLASLAAVSVAASADG